jgi:hypothetical protein
MTHRPKLAPLAFSCVFLSFNPITLNVCIKENWKGVREYHPTFWTCKDFSQLVRDEANSQTDWCLIQNSKGQTLCSDWPFNKSSKMTLYVTVIFTTLLVFFRSESNWYFWFRFSYNKEWKYVIVWENKTCIFSCDCCMWLRLWVSEWGVI